MDSSSMMRDFRGYLFETQSKTQAQLWTAMVLLFHAVGSRHTIKHLGRGSYMESVARENLSSTVDNRRGGRFWTRP